MPIFSLSPGVLIREEDFGGLAFVRATGLILRLSGGAYRELISWQSNQVGVYSVDECDVLRLRFCRKLERFGVVREVDNHEG